MNLGKVGGAGGYLGVPWCLIPSQPVQLYQGEFGGGWWGGGGVASKTPVKETIYLTGYSDCLTGFLEPL